MVPVMSPVDDVLTEDRMRSLYSAHAKPIYWFLLRLTLGDAHAAEDMLQETMLRAWRTFEGRSADIDALRPWLITVARRIAIDSGRARQARPAEVGVVDMTLLAADEKSIEQLLTSETVRAAMAILTPEHRGVIVEMYFRDRSVAETANVLGIPAGTVKSRAYYALRALRAAIGSTARA